MRTIVSLCVVIACLGCGDEPKKPASSATPSAPQRKHAEPVNANDLWREYGDNEIAADVKYKGKTIRLSGIPYVIGSDSGGQFVGMVVVSGPFGSNNSPPGIRAYIADSAKKQFASIRPGVTAEPIVVFGNVRRKKSESGSYNGYVVILEDCHID